MPRETLSIGDLSPRDYAFYGLVWASTTLNAKVDQALAKKHGMPLSWFEVMLWLNAQDEPVAASDLGAVTLLSRSQVSRVVDALDARGWAARTPSPTDARSIRVALTDEGRRIFAEADEARREALAELFEDLLTDEEVDSLGAIVHKIKAARAAGAGS